MFTAENAEGAETPPAFFRIGGVSRHL